MKNGKESIIQGLSTRSCGHADVGLLKAAEFVDLSSNELHQLVKEIVDPDVDCELEGMDEGQKFQYLSLKFIDYLWYVDGDEDRDSCNDCEQENFRNWIKASQD